MSVPITEGWGVSRSAELWPEYFIIVCALHDYDNSRFQMPTFCLNFLEKRPWGKASKLRGQEAISSWRVRHGRLETKQKWCIVRLGITLREGGSLWVVSGQTVWNSHAGDNCPSWEGFVNATYMSLVKVMGLLLKHFQVPSPEVLPYVIRK